MDFLYICNLYICNNANVVECEQTQDLAIGILGMNSKHNENGFSNGDLKKLVMKLAKEVERIRNELESLKKRTSAEAILDDSAILSINPEILAEFLSVLSSPERLSIMKLLYIRDRYFSELEELLDIGPSSLRHHLSKLMNSGLIIQERIRGKYKISEKGRQVLRILAELYEKFLKR